MVNENLEEILKRKKELIGELEKKNGFAMLIFFKRFGACP